MVYKGYKNRHDFTKFKTIQSFGEAIKNGIVTVDMVNDGKKSISEKN